MQTKVLSPVAESFGWKEAPLAHRLSTLQGKRIGLINNGWRSLRISYAEIRKLLQDKYNVASIVEKESMPTRPLLPADFESLAGQVDAVIVGLAN